MSSLVEQFESGAVSVPSGFPTHTSLALLPRLTELHGPLLCKCES